MPTEYQNGRVIVDITPQQKLSESLIRTQQDTLNAIQAQIENCTDAACVEAWNGLKAGIQEGIESDVFLYVDGSGGEFVSNIKLHVNETGSPFVKIGEIWYEFVEGGTAPSSAVQELPNFIFPWTDEAGITLEELNENYNDYVWKLCGNEGEEKVTASNGQVPLNSAVDNLTGEGGEPIEGVWILRDVDGGVSALAPEQPNIVQCGLIPE